MLKYVHHLRYSRQRIDKKTGKDVYFFSDISRRDVTPIFILSSCDATKVNYVPGTIFVQLTHYSYVFVAKIHSGLPTDLKNLYSEIAESRSCVMPAECGLGRYTSTFKLFHTPFDFFSVSIVENHLMSRSFFKNTNPKNSSLEATKIDRHSKRLQIHEVAENRTRSSRLMAKYFRQRENTLARNGNSRLFNRY